MSPAEVSVLLVEDNPDEVELAILAFQMDRIPAQIVVVRDGAEALDYMLPTGPRSGERLPRPALVLLDLKLPRVDGLEVLRRLRADERTRTIPVIVLSSSQEESDLRRSNELGADRYVRKPVNFTEFRDITRKLAATWLTSGGNPGGAA